MAIPALTRRGFWTRIVMFGANLLIYAWVVGLMTREHSIIGTALFCLLALLSVGGLVATVMRRPRYPGLIFRTGDANASEDFQDSSDRVASTRPPGGLGLEGVSSTSISLVRAGSAQHWKPLDLDRHEWSAAANENRR